MPRLQIVTASGYKELKPAVHNGARKPTVNASGLRLTHYNWQGIPANWPLLGILYEICWIPFAGNGWQLAFATPNNRAVKKHPIGILAVNYQYSQKLAGEIVDTKIVSESFWPLPLSSIKEDQKMQRPRFRLSILEVATNGFLCLRDGWLCKIAILAVCTSTLLAQQDNQLSRSVPSFPNPFRAGSASATGEASVPIPRELKSNAAWVDVIRLASLPPSTERPVVTAISVSPNGGLIAAAGDDHAIRVIDLKTGKTTATLTGHLDWVQSVEFSPNGQQLASCGNDGTLQVWSLDDKPTVIAKRSVSHALMTLTYLNDECIYLAGFSNRIYCHQTGQKELMVVHACDCRDIRSIVASPDRKWVAFGGRDGVLRVRRVDLAEQASFALQVPRGHKDADATNEWSERLHKERIRSLQFSLDGNQITSVGEDRRIVHYDVANRSVIGETEIGGGKLLGLCQLEPHLFAIASSDNTIRLFCDVDRKVQCSLVGHDGSVSILKRTQKYLISGSFDTTIRIWDIDRAIASIDLEGRYHHPVAAQFEDSGAGKDIR